MLLDATSAYDYVRHDTLICRIGELNPPPKMLRWICSFVRCRRVQTRWGRTTSTWRIMRRGVPQGCSISPILWLTYIRPLSAMLRSGDDGKVAAQPFMLADDITVVVAAADKETLDAATQEEVAKVEAFCVEAFIRLNPDKCNVLTVSMSPAVRTAATEVKVNGKVLKKVQTARLLGLTIDSQMHFKTHAKLARGRLFGRIRILRHITSRAWGVDERAIRQLVQGYIVPSVLYAAPAWFMGGHQSAVGKVKTAFNAALRLETGCIGGTKVEDLHALARQEPLEARVERQAASLANMALRHPQNTPARQVITPHPGPKRIRPQISTWRDVAARRLPPTVHARLAPLARWPAPWEELEVEWLAADCKRSDPDEVRKAAGEAAIEKARAITQGKKRWMVWTDGSVEESEAEVKARMEKEKKIKEAERTAAAAAAAAATAEMTVEERMVAEAMAAMTERVVATIDGGEPRKARGPGKGGAGVCIWLEEEGKPTEKVARLSLPAGEWATSFTAEGMAGDKGVTAARELAVQHCQRGGGGNHAIVVITDSKALWEALQGDPYRLKQDTLPAWRAMQAAAEAPEVDQVVVVWVSSHCGIEGNDAADELAAKACKKPQGRVALPSQAVKTRINAGRTQLPQPFKPPSKEAIARAGVNGRRAMTWLKQMWADHSPFTRKFLMKLRKVKDKYCLHCSSKDT
ncbi:MAG TPA: reverse transcriptase domain-containing protein, partial [Burkholderiaceae bacterium]|nr:reverse transcriptase domain-containing protein [Burkholderiaceae bacterium]